jgi:NTE family protein
MLVDSFRNETPSLDLGRLPDFAIVNYMTEGLLALPRPIYFVFGGGGSLGAAQVGMMNAVYETGLKPDGIIGTSVGAVNAAVMAEDPEGAADRLLAIWDDIGRSNIFPGNPAKWLMTLGLSETHLTTEGGLRNTLQKHLNTTQMTDLTLPFATVATDFDKAKPKIFTKGSLDDAITASAAIPTIFPLKEIDGRFYCDGGLVANVPVVQAEELGAASLVVFDCIGPMNWGRSNILEVMAGLAGVIQQNQRIVDLQDVAKRLPIIYLPPPTTLASPLSFEHTHELIDDAYTAGVEYFQNLELDKQPKPGLYGEIPSLERDKTD